MAPGILRAGALALRATSNICPASPTCPQDDQCTSIVNGVSFGISCATDFYGGDSQSVQTPTLAGCMEACSTTDGCVAASYVGQNCYLKNALSPASANADVISVTVTSRKTAVASAQTCPSSYSCPANNGCTFQGADSRPFTLSCGVDFNGGDRSNINVDSFESCTQACADSSWCVAASYVGGSGAGVCYLKDQLNARVTNNNVDAVFFDTRVQPSGSTPTVSSATSTPAVSSATSTPTVSSATSVLASTSTSTALSSLVSLSSTNPSVSSLSAPSSSSATSIGLTTSTSRAASTSLTAPSLSSSSPTLTSTASSIAASTLSRVLVSSSSASSPTATPLLTGTNLLTNPGFETTSGWTMTSNAYPVTLKSSAHGGSKYITMFPSILQAAELSQAVTVPDVTRPYTVSFWWSPSSFKLGLLPCTLDVFMNNSNIYSKTVTSADNPPLGSLVSWQAVKSKSFTLSSPNQTLKFRYQCGLITSYILLDDVTLTYA